MKLRQINQKASILLAHRWRSLRDGPVVELSDFKLRVYFSASSPSGNLWLNSVDSVLLYDFFPW